MKIRGNTVGTTMKRPDFNQTDERKSDYIKNNPIPVVNEEDEGKIPVVEDGAYVLKEKNSILELVQEIFVFDEEGPSTKKAPSQLATMNALERYMPSGAFNNHVEETIIPMQKRIGTLETTSESHGEAIDGLGNAIDEIASKANDLETKKANTYKRVVVDTFTTTEEAVISKDYSAYKAKGMYVKMVVPAGTVANNRGLACYFTTGSTGNIWCGYGILRVTDGSANYTGYIRCFDENGEWVTEFYDGSQTIKHGISGSGIDNTTPSNLYIKKFCSHYAIPSGVTFTVSVLLPVGEEEI